MTHRFRSLFAQVLLAAPFVAATATASDLQGTAGAASVQQTGVALPSPAHGSATREWLALQRSGRVAGTAHSIPGEIADLSWRRYLDSYRQPIPERFSSPMARPEAGR